MRFLVIAVLCLFSVSSIGCSNNSAESAFAEASDGNVKKCCAMYAIYTTLNNYKGPGSKDELVEFLTNDSQAATRLERMGVDPTKLDSYTVGRDGEPLEFRWGLESSPISPAYVICWEQIGIDGKIQVGVSGGKIVETDDEDELAELKAGNYSSGAAYGESMNTKTIVEEN